MGLMWPGHGCKITLQTAKPPRKHLPVSSRVAPCRSVLANAQQPLAALYDEFVDKLLMLRLLIDFVGQALPWLMAGAQTMMSWLDVHTRQLTWSVLCKVRCWMQGSCNPGVPAPASDPTESGQLESIPGPPAR